MKKSALASAIAMSMGLGAAHGAALSSATFIMYDPAGNLVSNTCGGSGNCPNGVDPTLTGTIDVGSGTWSVASSETFFGSNWLAHDGSSFGPGTYTFGTAPSSGPKYTGMVVGAGQVGGHVLFDWGNPSTVTTCGVAECSIDVINVWNVNTAAGVTTYTSVDFAVNKSNFSQTSSTVIGPDGIPGAPILDSATFLSFHPNFDMTTTSAVPVPAAVWLFGTGLLGLVGVGRRKKNS